MSSIQYEIDSFQQTLDDMIKNSQPKQEEPSVDVDTIRSDVFVRSTIATQSEMIGKALLEVFAPYRSRFRSTTTTPAFTVG